jgi:hypothetical protein
MRRLAQSFARTTAATALAALMPLATAVHAQQTEAGQGGQTTQDQGQIAQEGQPQAQSAQAEQAEAGQAQSAPSQGGGGQQPGMGAETLIATVGGADITGADVIAVIDTLPPQLRQQPPQLLVPMAVDSLVLRELILQEARARNLGEDAEVRALVDAAGRAAEEDAMVQVYLQRELESRVTDEAVQQTYESLTQSVEGEAPALDQVRPQIEQRLGQQALQSLRTELEGDVEVVFYGPDGQPMEAAGGAQGMGEQSGVGSPSGEGAQATDAQPSGEQPADASTGGTD